jgi:filamin
MNSRLSAAKSISKVIVSGKASMLGQALTDNEFTVDSRSVGSVIGPLKVDVKGPLRSKTQVDIKDNENGTYNILYKPTTPGMYTMDIKIAEQHIPDSPLIIKVM